MLGRRKNMGRVEMWLRDNDFQFRIDSDGRIRFKLDECNFLIIEQDSVFGVITKVYELRRFSEKWDVLEFCNKLNCKSKYVRAILHNDKFLYLLAMFNNNIECFDDFMRVLFREFHEMRLRIQTDL